MLFTVISDVIRLFEVTVETVAVLAFTLANVIFKKEPKALLESL
jgi:hypothetical protein